jgi:hypothetical protein
VLQAVTPSLFSAEPYLAIASLALALARAIRQICQSDLLRFLCVRKYSILGNVVAKEIDQDELAIVVVF